jgi:predicted anti-sigma-YlaC factor YlaD
MNCREVRKTLSAYLEKEVSPAMAGKIEAHLAGCENCRLLTEELKALKK